MLARSKVIERRPKVLRGAAARPGSPRTSSADSYAAAGGRPHGFMLRRGSVEAATVGHRRVAAAALARAPAQKRSAAAVSHPQGYGGGRAVHLGALPAAAQQADAVPIPGLLLPGVGADPVRRETVRQPTIPD